MKQSRVTFRAQCAAHNQPCWLCGQAIDYDASPTDTTNKDRFQLDHFYPVSTHPQFTEDPTNYRASHADCNNKRGNRAPTADLGIPSRSWT